jgi:hypothetical protein
VAKAVLEARADNQYRDFGQPNPPLTITYTGFVNGDTVAALDSLPVASCAATTNSPPGVYPITVSGGADDNYNFAPMGGVLVITIPVVSGLTSPPLPIGQSNPDLFERASTITVTALDTNLISSVTFSGSGSNLTMTVTTRPGSSGPTTVTLRITETNGMQTTLHLPLYIHEPGLTVIRQIDGTNTLNPQTSLYEQTVRLTNTSTVSFPGTRLTVTALDTNVYLYNATGTNALGQPYVDLRTPLAPGASLTFILEYFSKGRRPFPAPTLDLEVIVPSEPPLPPGWLGRIDRVFVSASGRLYLEFVSEAGRTYHVLYSDHSASGPWKTSPAPIAGTGYRVHWADDGPPKTETPPGPARFYQLLVQ